MNVLKQLYGERYYYTVPLMPAERFMSATEAKVLHRLFSYRQRTSLLTRGFRIPSAAEETGIPIFSFRRALKALEKYGVTVKKLPTGEMVCDLKGVVEWSPEGEGTETDQPADSTTCSLESTTCSLESTTCASEVHEEEAQHVLLKAQHVLKKHNMCSKSTTCSLESTTCAKKAQHVLPEPDFGNGSEGISAPLDLDLRSDLLDHKIDLKEAKPPDPEPPKAASFIQLTESDTLEPETISALSDKIEEATVAPPSDISLHVGKCIQIAIHSCRGIARLISRHPETECSWWGAGFTPGDQAKATELYSALQAEGMTETGIEDYFALAPFFAPGGSFNLFSSLCRETKSAMLPIPEVRDTLETLTTAGKNTRDLIDLLDIAIYAVPVAGGSIGKPPTAKQLGKLTGLIDEVKNRPSAFGAVDEYFRAKYLSWMGWSEEQRKAGKSIPNPSVWHVISTDAKIPMSKPSRDASDPWAEIREFLGLGDDVTFPDGCIPAGWKISRVHEAQSMALTSRGKGFKGTAEDVRRISLCTYLTHSGDQFWHRAHGSGAIPNGRATLKCTPENFHEFKENWFEDRDQKLPSLDMYRKYGSFAGDLDEEGNLKGMKVKWGKG